MHIEFHTTAKKLPSSLDNSFFFFLHGNRFIREALDVSGFGPYICSCWFCVCVCDPCQYRQRKNIPQTQRYPIKANSDKNYSVTPSVIEFYPIQAACMCAFNHVASEPLVYA